MLLVTLIFAGTSGWIELAIGKKCVLFSFGLFGRQVTTQLFNAVSPVVLKRHATLASVKPIDIFGVCQIGELRRCNVVAVILDNNFWMDLGRLSSNLGRS